jgi:hypothetical protein
MKRGRSVKKSVRRTKVRKSRKSRKVIRRSRKFGKNDNERDNPVCNGCNKKIKEDEKYSLCFGCLNKYHLRCVTNDKKCVCGGKILGKF